MHAMTLGDCLNVLLTTTTLLQGYTKFSKFGDLDALSEEDWDKVRFLPLFSLRPHCKPSTRTEH